MSGPSYSHSMGSSQWIHTSGPFPSHSAWPPQWPHHFTPLPFYPYGPTHLPGHLSQLEQPSIPSADASRYVGIPSTQETSSLQTVYEPPRVNNNPFTLKFITNRITKCQGCKGSLQSPDNSLPTLPQDLIVAQLECRPYVAADGSAKVLNKPSCAHYHLKMDCLVAADVKFKPCNIVVPLDVRKCLKSEHQELLNDFGFSTE